MTHEDFQKLEREGSKGEHAAALALKDDEGMDPPAFTRRIIKKELGMEDL